MHLIKHTYSAATGAVSSSGFTLSCCRCWHIINIKPPIQIAIDCDLPYHGINQLPLRVQNDVPMTCLLVIYNESEFGTPEDVMCDCLPKRQLIATCPAPIVTRSDKPSASGELVVRIDDDGTRDD